MRQRRFFLRGLCAALLIFAAAGRVSAQMGRVNGIVKDVTVLSLLYLAPAGEKPPSSA